MAYAPPPPKKLVVSDYADRTLNDSEKQLAWNFAAKDLRSPAQPQESFVPRFYQKDQILSLWDLEASAHEFVSGVLKNGLINEDTQREPLMFVQKIFLDRLAPDELDAEPKKPSDIRKETGIINGALQALRGHERATKDDSKSEAEPES